MWAFSCVVRMTARAAHRTSAWHGASASTLNLLRTPDGAMNADPSLLGVAMTEFNAGKILIVGLGNPGAKYDGTRHNIGRDLVTELAQVAHASLSSSSFDGFSATAHLGGKQVVLLQPETYMNRSGFSVVKAAQFYRIDARNIIVAHDEIEIEPGTVRLKRGGGHAGHNGLRSIDQQLGTRDYLRVRLGVGRPPEGGNVSRWVLSRFGKADADAQYDLLRRGQEAIEQILAHDLQTAQNYVHALK